MKEARTGLKKCRTCYGTEVVISVKIGMPSLRSIREAKSKAKMEKYYNIKVRSTAFKPETSYTTAMKLAMQRNVESLTQNGKDRIRWWKHFEKEHTRLGMGVETYSRAPGMSKT
nr:hypothetical protein [Tanacetum cinerariifolium]